MSESRERIVDVGDVGVLGREESEENEITEGAIVRGRRAMWNRLASGLSFIGPMEILMNVNEQW